MRKRFPVISSATRGPYRVQLIQEESKAPNRVFYPTAWLVHVSPSFDPSCTPMKRVNFGRYGYRNGMFRYRAAMFPTHGTMENASKAARAAAMDKMITIVEMLNSVEAELLHA